MRHGKNRSRLGVKAAHRVAMLRNLTLGLVKHGRIKTTLPRARKLRPFLEPIVTRLREPTVANIRVANALLNNRDVVLEIAQKIAPKFKTRPGGYLRILKLATPRAGDAADMALIEWSDESLVPAYSAEPVAKSSTKNSTKKKATAQKVGKTSKKTAGAKKSKAKSE
jgi:large subunit ribosomal protein L17